MRSEVRRLHLFELECVQHRQSGQEWVPHWHAEWSFGAVVEGGDFVDPQFAQNWQQAGAADVARGGYHFFTLCKPGAEQAANFIATVPKEAAALPPAVDLEYMGNCSDRPATLDVQAELGAATSEVKS